MSEVQTRQQIDTNVVVAHRIRAIMKDQRWSARKAAERLGLQNTFISRRLSGETPLDPNDLVMFSEFLHVPIAAFFTGPDDNGAVVTEMDTSKNVERPLSDYSEVNPRPIVHLFGETA